MPSASAYKALYGTKRWKSVRRLVLARAGGVCEMTAGCPNVATTVDHIVPALELAMTGRLAEFYDPLLLRAACRPCNASGGASFGNRHRRRRRQQDRQDVLAGWAARENAYWAEVERRAGRPSPRPAIW